MSRGSELFKRILVPVDGIGSRGDVLLQADRLALATGAQVVLLDFLHADLDLEGNCPPITRETDRKVQQMHDSLMSLAGTHMSRSVGFATAVLIRAGDARTIAGHAEIIGADLTVAAGDRGRPTLLETGSGAGQQLVDSAPCPVMFVGRLGANRPTCVRTSIPPDSTPLRLSPGTHRTPDRQSPPDTGPCG